MNKETIGHPIINDSRVENNDGVKRVNKTTVRIKDDKFNLELEVVKSLTVLTFLLVCFH